MLNCIIWEKKISGWSLKAIGFIVTHIYASRYEGNAWFFVLRNWKYSHRGYVLCKAEIIFPQYPSL